MKNSEFEISNKKLKKLLTKNYEQIDINEEKARMVMVNGLDHKVLTTLSFAAITYIALFLVSASLTHVFGTGVIANIFPGVTYPIAFIGSSLGVGILGENLLAKKNQTKKKFKSFSNAKTQSEKLYEEACYLIEAEKAKNRNKVIDEVVRRLDLEYSNEGLNINENSLFGKVQEGYERLDILSTKRVLCDNFFMMRDSFQRKTQILIVPILSIILTTLIVGLPTMFIKDSLFIDSSLINSVIMNLPFGVGVLGTATYMLKRNSDYKKSFNRLNDLLGENALDDKLSKFEDLFEEDKKIKDLIQSEIISISTLLVKLYENDLNSCVKLDGDEENLFKSETHTIDKINADGDVFEICMDGTYADGDIEEKNLPKKKSLKKYK